MQETLARLGSTKEQMDSKYEQKRRQFKEQESILLRQITEMQKEKAVLDEKLFHSESKKDEIKIKLE